MFVFGVKLPGFPGFRVAGLWLFNHLFAEMKVRAMFCRL